MINKLEFSIEIKAERNEIWRALWGDSSYPIWAGVFYEGSFVLAKSWEEGSFVHFLSPEKNGIYSCIELHVPGETIRFRHIGNVVNGEEVEPDEDSKRWSGATEIYRLNESEYSFLTLSIEIDILDEHLEFMSKTMPEALKKIKFLSERTMNS